MHFADALTAATKSTSPICVGLDPMMDKLPEGTEKSLKGMKDFLWGILEAVEGIAPVVKPQMAYYELHGWEGMKLFWEVCTEAKKRGFLVIADGKRNDIGSTCDAYADAYLSSNSPIDALTVTPYLGSDGVTPFIQRCAKNGKGIFVLVKTSNASSGELQDLPVGDEAVHEHLAQLVESWGAQQIGPDTSLSCVGAVVGATYPEEMKYLRTLMPHIPFLIPGYGAQGGTASDAAHGFLPDGTGAIVNAARSILYASKGSDWQDAAHNAAQAMKDEIAAALEAR